MFLTSLPRLISQLAGQLAAWLASGRSRPREVQRLTYPVRKSCPNSLPKSLPNSLLWPFQTHIGSNCDAGPIRRMHGSKPSHSLASLAVNPYGLLRKPPNVVIDPKKVSAGDIPEDRIKGFHSMTGNQLAVLGVEPFGSFPKRLEAGKVLAYPHWTWVEVLRLPEQGEQPKEDTHWKRLENREWRPRSILLCTNRGSSYVTAMRSDTIGSYGAEYMQLDHWPYAEDESLVEEKPCADLDGIQTPPTPQRHRQRPRRHDHYYIPSAMPSPSSSSSAAS